MLLNPIQNKKYGWLFRLASFLLILVGGFALRYAIRASNSGLDLDGRWGPYRLLLAGAGATLLLLGSLPWLALLWHRFFYRIWQPRIAVPWRATPACRRLRTFFSRLKRWPPFAWWADHPARSGRISAILLLSLCAVIYYWYATVGYGFDNSKYPSYYQMLANAFRHGQASLLVEPDPALAQLKNPYDINQRGSIAYLWDVSYYQGKYYLYWGPAPVLGQWLLETVLARPVGDAYLITFYAVALAGVLFGILYVLWRRFFSGLSWGAFSAVLFAVGFSNPILWLVSRPATYEASIMAGQFYLLAGIWAALPLLQGETVRFGRLVLAGLGWSLAVLSRSTLAIPVIFLTAYCAWQLYHSGKSYWRPFLALGVPLALGAGFLMAYNWVRFDSVFEFGQRYQLSSFNQFEDGDLMFQARYIPMNLFNYLFNPVNGIPKFPFIEPIRSTLAIKGTGISAPNNYSGQWLSGLLITIPLLYALIAFIIRLLHPQERGSISPALRRLIFALGIAAILEFGVILVFFSSSMRYTMDCIPTLLILSALGVWSLLEWAQRAPHRVWVPVALAVLVLLNISVGLLLGISGENQVFAHQNPALFAQLSAWFGH